MRKSAIAQLLKLIGIGMFLWILLRIDRDALMQTIAASNKGGIALAFLLLVLGMYSIKAWRWHLLVKSTGLEPTLHDSWKLFHIGIFLGSITPANLGEFGRIAYLKKKGLHAGTGTMILLLDRLADVGAMGSVGVFGILLLFGWNPFFLAVLSGLAGVAGLLLAWTKSKKLRTRLPWLQFLATLSQPKLLLGYMLSTMLAWTMYFVWTIVLARSVGIEAGIPVLIASLTLTGIVSLLPISPSGLGTRDATLLFLLKPFGVESSQSVALSLLMFVLILLSGLPGLIYWLIPHKHKD